MIIDLNEPHNPTPAEMQVLLSAICIMNGSVLACDASKDGGVTFGPNWFAMPADEWHAKYGG